MLQSKISEFYKNQNVLITGGTGYFGKIIIQKLLSTTEVKNIFLIVRPKAEMDFDKRVVKMFDEEVFKNINKEVFLNKVRPIEGDLMKKCIGIEEENCKFLRENVNIVFHCGATLNMDSNLADAVLTNVNGTAELLKIMKMAKALKAFVLVSTAYSHCLNKIIDERFYEPPIDPILLIRLVEGMKIELLNKIASEIIGNWPNTYTFTKAVAENLLIAEGENMPVSLFRPTIVTSTVSDPVPGWADNLYGPLGILLSSNCGILRVVRGKSWIKADTVPGDLVINGLLCYAWDVGNKWIENPNTFTPPVLNFSGCHSPLYISIKQYTQTVRECEYPPFKRTIWKPMLTIVNNRIVYEFLKFMLHEVPAFLFDSMFLIVGQKPRMQKIYTKLNKVAKTLHHFLINEWQIENENMKILWEKLDKNDQIVYNFDLSNIDTDRYFRNLMIGLKKYILKEDMSKEKSHRQKYKRLLLLHKTLKYVCMLLIGYPIFQSFFKLIKTAIVKYCILN